MFRKTKCFLCVVCSGFALCFGFLLQLGCDGLQQARTCTPFSQRICACIDGYQGSQNCNEGGSQWSSCVCKGSQVEIPTESVPSEGSTTETVPETSTESIPTESVPTESVPTEPVPTEPVLDGGVLDAMP